VLFSEPKIPQFVVIVVVALRVMLFQCSSASRKFLNRRDRRQQRAEASGFSALQRAENSSILALAIGVTLGARMLFQCSSASRKFLNATRSRP